MDIRRVRVTDGSRPAVTLRGDGRLESRAIEETGEARNRAVEVGTARVSLPAGQAGSLGRDAASACRLEAYQGDIGENVIGLAIGAED